MKKFLYTLGIALTWGLVANAASPEVKMAKANLNSEAATAIASISSEALNIKPIAKKKNVSGKKRVATAQDWIGEYEWAGDNLLNGVVYPNEGTMNVTEDPYNPGKLIVTGLGYYYADLVNCYVENGRLYIPNQVAYYNDYFGCNVLFQNHTVRNGTNSEGQPSYPLSETSNPFFFTMDTESGYIMAGDLSLYSPDKWNNHQYTDAELAQVFCAAGLTFESPDLEGSYQFLCAWIEGQRLYVYDLNLDEWYNLGTTSYKDIYFPNFWQDANTPVYDVTLYRNKADENTFMVYEPYGPKTPYGDQDFQGWFEGDKGAIIFNIEDPDCVVMQPLVYTASMDFGDENNPDWSNFYMYNFEGQNYYLGGTSKEDIFVNFLKNEMEVSTLYTSPSQSIYPGLKNPVVEIWNGIFGQTGEMTAAYQWVNVETNEPYELAGYIEMTSNYDDPNVYVQAIGEENNEAPVYYNINGVRVNNPEKGQLLIVKKGATTSKQIIR